MSDTIELITVDKDAYDFLKVIYFGTITDPFEAASFRAYRDFNRTLRFHDLKTNARTELRKEATVILRQRITELVSSGVSSQKDFDFWHKTTCRMICSLYQNKGVVFTCGQAQKWLNMTIKYLYIIGSCSFEGVFPYCHVPIDNYVFRIAKNEFGIPMPETAWSRWTDYDAQYMEYQKKLRSYIKGLEPLRWEFKYWMKEARNLHDN